MKERLGRRRRSEFLSLVPDAYLSFSSTSSESLRCVRIILLVRHPLIRQDLVERFLDVGLIDEEVARELGLEDQRRPRVETDGRDMEVSLRCHFELATQLTLSSVDFSSAILRRRPCCRVDRRAAHPSVLCSAGRLRGSSRPRFHLHGGSFLLLSHIPMSDCSY